VLVIISVLLKDTRWRLIVSAFKISGDHLRSTALIRPTGSTAAPHTTALAARSRATGKGAGRGTRPGRGHRQDATQIGAGLLEIAKGISIEASMRTFLGFDDLPHLDFARDAVCWWASDLYMKHGAAIHAFRFQRVNLIESAGKLPLEGAPRSVRQLERVHYFCVGRARALDLALRPVVRVIVGCIAARSRV